MDPLAGIKEREARRREAAMGRVASSDTSSTSDALREFERKFGEFLTQSEIALSSRSPGEAARLLSEASRVLSECSSWLTPRDVQISQSRIDSLRSRVAGSGAAAKPKFSFSKSVKKGGAAPAAPVPVVASAVADPLPEEEEVKGTMVVQERCGETIVVEKNESRALTVKNCRDCVVRVMATGLGLVRLEGLQRCSVCVVPVVDGSVHASACDHCSIAVCCWQLRVHLSKSCRISCLVRSSPIVESSSCLEFSRYSPSSSDPSSTFSSWVWDRVDDFDWFRKDQRSPNWTAVDTQHTPESLPEIPSSIS